MDKAKIKRLEKKGWKVGDAYEFLGLTPEEKEYVEIRLALSREMRERRIKRKLTQAQAARLLHSSQSRVAKIEAGDPSVSLDLQIRSLIMLGASRKDLGTLIGP